MAKRRKGRPINGILLLDKPYEMSSNYALQAVKRLYFAQKAGHTGALDPLATGMLPICLGEGTKFSQFLLDTDKTYQVTAKLLASILPSNEKWVLTMDRTNWKLGKSNVNLLVLGVAYKGMAIPLIWDFLTIEEEVDNETSERGKRGNSNTEERKDLLKEFIEIFGIEKIESLTADRDS